MSNGIHCNAGICVVFCALHSEECLSMVETSSYCIQQKPVITSIMGHYPVPLFSLSHDWPLQQFLLFFPLKTAHHPKQADMKVHDVTHVLPH